MCITEENEMMIPKEVFDLRPARKLLDDMIMANMKSNYLLFVREHGHEGANQRMEGMFPNDWEKNKEEIWQWFDFEIDKVNKNI